MQRIFIVAPQREGDSRYHVCMTKSKAPFQAVYLADECIVIGSFDSLDEAKVNARIHGSRRPTVI